MRHRLAPVSVALFVSGAVALAGCAASTVPGSQGGKSAAVQHTSPVSSAPSNRARAVIEANRLLKIAPRPPGSQVAHPNAAQRAAMPGSVPGVRSLIDVSRYLSVPMSLDAAMTWLDAHRPAGLAASGTMTMGMAGARPGGRAVFWTASAGAAWSSSELHVGVVPLGTARTLWRVEAQVVWLDSVPLRDDAAGPRLRVLATGSCPRSDRGAVGVTNPAHDLTMRLLPAGVPSAAVVCDYAGLNGSPAFGLSRTVHLDRNAAARLASAVGRIDLSHPDGARVSCPMDDGTATVIAFAYAGRADVDLWYHSTGCRSVANGAIAASAGLPVR